MRVITVFLTVLLPVAACSDGPVGPPLVPDIVVENPIQWSGSAVQLRSTTFETSSVTGVLIADTLVAVQRIGPGMVEFTIPPLTTGLYEADVRFDGGVVARVSIHVVGLAGTPQFIAGGVFSNTVDSYPMSSGSLLIAECCFFPGVFSGGYGIANLIDGQTIAPIPQLLERDGNLVKMNVPGPSFRNNHYVLDLSPDGVFDVQVWRILPDVAPVATLPCGFVTGATSDYTVAEISSADCLELRSGQVWRNGSSLLLDDLSLRAGQFRMAPDGAWTVVATRPHFITSIRLENWPVFGPDAQIAYMVDRYSAVRGAAFSSTGEALYVAARGRDLNETWRLDHLDPSTGDVRQSLELPGAGRLFDVVVDEIRSRLFVTSAVHVTGPPVLHVIDLESLELLATVAAPLLDGPCLFGGDIGVMTTGTEQVHLASFGAADCGILHWTFDLK